MSCSCYCVGGESCGCGCESRSRFVPSPLRPPTGISGGTALVFHVVLDKHIGTVTYVMAVLVEDEDGAAFPGAKRPRGEE